MAFVGTDYGKYNIVYSRDQLTRLRTMGRVGCIHPIPEEIKRLYRGVRAGASRRAGQLKKRWRFKPSIPLCVMGNVNSLTNKMDKFSALVKNVRLYKECSLMCFTETWLIGHISDANVELPGFTIVRADRGTKLSGKRKGGGLALY